MAALTLAFTDPSSLSLDTLLGHYLNGTLWGAGDSGHSSPPSSFESRHSFRSTACTAHNHPDDGPDRVALPKVNT